MRPASPRVPLAAAALLLALLLAPAPARAEDEPKPEPKPATESEMWKRLKGRDANGDGVISRDEFPGRDRMWRRLDADGDGQVTRGEADKASERMGGGMGRGRGGEGMGRGGRGRMGGGLSLEALDTDGDGKVSKKEWDAFFAKADKNEDGALDKTEFDSATSRRGRPDHAPKVGDDAPKVSAQIRGMTAKIDLAKPKRTTVLIFGSWT